VAERADGTPRGRTWPRVHFYTDNPVLSGSETTLYEVLRFLAEQGADPVLTVRTWPGYRPRQVGQLPDVGVDERPLGPPALPVMLESVRVEGRPRLTALARNTLDTLVRLPWFALAVLRLWVLFRRTRPDVVHVNNGGLPGARSCTAAAVAARLAGVPGVVYAVHNIAHDYRRPARWLDYPLERLMMRRPPIFVTGSEAAGRSLARVLRLSPAGHRVVPNAVVARPATADIDTLRDRCGIDRRAGLVVSVARLEVRKGHTVLLEALAELGERGPTPLLLLAGEGPERAALEARAAELGLSAQVRFLGASSHVRDLMEMADVVVLASVGFEDFPVVVLEAMAASRPVVATTVGGTVEQVVDEVSGLLVPPGDPRRLADAIGRVLADPAGAARMGAAGRERFDRRFSSASVVDRYLEVYRAAATAGPPA